jgi:A/G-specific adenine glycosylase
MRTTDNNIHLFQSLILQWFEINRRVFPWRKVGLSNYQIIISEILLQRTKAETVSKFYEKFIADYPDWQSLFSANLKGIEEYLRPVGLHMQRASRLHKLAEYMVKNGEVLPERRIDLEKIPFMGQYIANAVELQIFNKRMPLLDVNMARVLERFFGPRKLADIRYDSYLQNLALKVVNHPKSKEINWAILDFSALICKARKPICLICPLSEKCLFFKSYFSDC